MGLVRRLLDNLLKGQPPSGVLDGEEIYEGADDLWPPDPPQEQLFGFGEFQIGNTRSAPETIVTQQYGLRLPSGEIRWNTWEDIAFGNPVDRLRMVATLQNSAAHMGFDEAEFLAQYGWVTRNQIAQVVYEDTGAYILTDPQISAVVTPSLGETHDDHNSTAAEGSYEESDLDGAVCRRSVGGDAQ